MMLTIEKYTARQPVFLHFLEHSFLIWKVEHASEFRLWQGL